MNSAHSSAPKNSQPSSAEEGSSSHSVAVPPSSFDLWTNFLFRGACQLFAWLTIALLAFIFILLVVKAKPAVEDYGLGLLIGTTWNPNSDPPKYGILPQIWGTLYSSLLALGIAGFFGISIAIYLTQDFLPTWLEWLFKNIIELLAAIPSVVYGLWGIFVVIPFIKPACNWLHESFGWFPLFSTSLIGPGMFPATLVLAIMILPTVTAVSRDALVSVPTKIREAAFGLGATRWEVILKVILPTAGTGIFGALVLGLGRALGETMALAMLVGSSNKLSWSLFSPADTLAALLANNFNEAGEVEVGVLLYAALVLMALTLSVNMAGTALVRRALANLEGTK